MTASGEYYIVFIQHNTAIQFFNDFAFIILFQHKGYLNSWLYLVSFSFTTGHHFCMCVICTNLLGLFSTLILGSFSATTSSFTGIYKYAAVLTIHVQIHVALRQCGWSGLTRDLSRLQCICQSDKRRLF